MYSRSLTLSLATVTGHHILCEVFREKGFKNDPNA